MKLEYKDGNLQFDFFEAIKSIPEEQRPELLEDLSCDDVIIKHVTDQILDGWTENFCSGGSCVSAQASPTIGLDYARREIAKRSSEIAKKEIENLEKELKKVKEDYWKMVEQNSYGRGY